MTTREDAIELGRDAMGRNDGWRWWAPRHLERLFDLWEPIIRADERERAAAEGVRIARVTLDIARDDLAAEVRERLRAQVKALRHEDECDVSRGRERPETGMAECNCLRADVLDLLGGESE